MLFTIPGAPPTNNEPERAFRERNRVHEAHYELKDVSLYNSTNDRYTFVVRDIAHKNERLITNAYIYSWTELILSLT
jgi:hypothetical protein